MRGVVALSTLLGIGLIITALATAIGLVAFIENYIGFGERQSNLAYAVAGSGIQDAIQRLLQHPDCFTTTESYNCSGTIFLNVGSGTASTTISQSQENITITSEGSVQNRKRRIQVQALQDSVTKELRITSWKEI